MRCNDQDLKLLERALASVLGPMARVLVKKAVAAGHDHLDDLVQALAGHLETRHERRRFMDEIRALGGLKASPLVEDLVALPEVSAPAEEPRVPSSVPVLIDEVRPLTPEFLAYVTHTLSAAMGPMARLLVKQAQQRTDHIDAFIKVLLSSLPDSVDRAALSKTLSEW